MNLLLPLIFILAQLAPAPAPAPDVWRLFVYSTRLLPIEESAGAPAGTDRYDRALSYRLELAAACAEATTDRSERYICIKVARFESSFREDVARCVVNGKAGDKSAWQIVPRSKAEDARLCRSVAEDARFHVERVRESRTACQNRPKYDQLALYTRGDCDSDEGRKLSRQRFPSDAEIKKLETEKW